MKAVTLLALLTLPAFAAPSQIARESFEGTPGSIGYSVVKEFGSGGVEDYNQVIPNNGTRISGNRVIAGADGSFIFGAEDVDAPVAHTDSIASVTFNAVAISGLVNNSVRIRLAAPGSPTTTSLYDSNDGSPLTREFVSISARIDGGPWQVLARYSPHRDDPGVTSLFNSYLSRDTNLDGFGDVAGDALGASFRDLTFPIGSGASVQVRVDYASNATNEYILFDDLRIFGEMPATDPPVISGVPGAALVFTEGGPATPVAPGLTLSDPDGTTLTSASVSISQNFRSGEDVLAATPAGSILAGDINVSGGVLTINKTASLADYQAVLRGVTYLNTNTTNPDTAPRSVSFQVNDGTNPSNTASRMIEVIDIIPVQAIPFAESFETDGRGTRYGVLGGFQDGESMFTRLATPSPFTNANGAFVWVVEDTDRDPAPLEAVTVQLAAAGFSDLQVTLAVGADGEFEQSNDRLTVEASVDGGSWQPVGRFRATGAVQSPLALDTDGDEFGDGTVLGAALQDFTFDLPEAEILGLRIVAATTSNDERIVFDNLRVSGTATSFSIADGSAAEDGGSVSLPVTRTGPATGSATFDYAITAGTATAGVDFDATGGTLTFADGESTVNVVVPVTADDIVELDETFTVTISNPSTGTIGTATATGTILNDDSATLSLAGGSVIEGDTGTAELIFTVSLSQPVDAAVTVDRAILDTGTATSGVDFTPPAPGSVTIAAGSLSETFSVSVIGDHDVEPDETVIAEISNLNAAGRSVTLGTTTATGTILDDDPEIIAGTGALALKLGAGGKLRIPDLLALASGGEGRPLSLVSVQAGTTSAGGSVVIVDGWISYQPQQDLNSTDSFTYTISDGFQTVTGTVEIVVSPPAGETLNIFRMIDEGTGKRILALGIPGRLYKLQSSENLTDWDDVPDTIGICPPGGAISLLDPGPLPPTRFYRVIETTLF